MAFILMGLFPPWQSKDGLNKGYGFLLVPPSASARVDLVRLALQLAVIAATTAAASRWLTGEMAAGARAALRRLRWPAVVVVGVAAAAGVLWWWYSGALTVPVTSVGFFDMGLSEFGEISGRVRNLSNVQITEADVSVRLYSGTPAPTPPADRAIDELTTEELIEKLSEMPCMIDSSRITARFSVDPGMVASFECYVHGFSFPPRSAQGRNWYWTYDVLAVRGKR